MNKKLIKFIEEYGITSDLELIELCKKLKIKLKYIGFAEDFKFHGDGAYIINLGNQDIGGTHWTSLFIENDHCFYFDSYAVGPEDILLDKLIPHCDHLIYNDYIQMQGIDEQLCGIYVILFLNNMTFSKKKTLNDRFTEFIKNYIDLDGDYSSGKTI